MKLQHVPRRKSNAFTLVELLVAISIIAVLSVVAYFGISKTQDLMKNSRVTNDLLAIESALNQYFHDHEEKFPIPEPGFTFAPSTAR